MHVRRANYWAAIWRQTVFSLGDLFLAHMAMAGSASLNHPVSHSSDEIQWMTRPAAPQASSFVGPDHMRLHIGLLHTALYVDAAKDILPGVKLVAAQTARISHTSQHPSSMHMKTKRLTMLHISYCIVSVYFFNSSAGKSQLIIPVCSISPCNTTFNHTLLPLSPFKFLS